MELLFGVQRFVDRVGALSRAKHALIMIFYFRF